MPAYSMEYDQANGDTVSSSATLTKGGKSRQAGCYVTSLMGFVLVLLALVVVVGVALIVFFALDSKSDVTCRFEQEEDQTINQCQTLISQGLSAAQKICSACPAPTITAAPTTTMTTAAMTTTTGIEVEVTSQSPTSSPSYPRSEYRLPSSVRPNRYKLRLQPNIYGDDPSTFTFEGSVTINVTCHTVTDVITLHVDRLQIDNNHVSVKDELGDKLVIVNISYVPQPHFYRIHLGQNLQANKTYVIEFQKFTGNLTTDGQGLYLSSYKDGNTTVYLATTQFEAPYARKAFPCFDEPALKATFQTTLVRKTSGVSRKYLTLSNMDLNTTNTSGDWTEDIYYETMVMSTYLLAFVVCDYSNLTGNVSNTIYRTWARPNAIQYADLAQRHGLRQFAYFENHFDPAYHTIINKLDNIAIPDFNAGAMENWGLITYREGLLFKPGVAAASDEKWIAEVISHEIAHMWFGNIVSPKWWTWLWLNEAFASFWDVFSVHKTQTDWRMMDIDVAQGLHSVLSTDALASSHPMSADVETREEVSSIFDAITYTKGAYVVRMMHFIMGEDRFIQGLNRYLHRHQFGVAEHMDLWNALTEVSLNTTSGSQRAAGVNMTLAMDPWVTQMGYPLVKVQRHGNQLTFTQQRFLLGSENSTDDRYKNPPYNYKWEIPVTYTTSAEKNFNKTEADIHWLHKHQDLTINLPAGVDWYLVNVQQYGYFRVQYDLNNWEALIRQLNADHTVIHPINRAQIINDAWNLVRAGELNMTTALRVLDYLPKELDYVPWRAFAREIDYVRLMLDRSELYPLLEEFVKKAVTSSLDRDGLDIPDNSAIIVAYTRQQIADYACAFGHPTCVSKAEELFKEWRTTGVNRINANLRYRFYCTAVENGGATEWNFLYAKFKAEDDASENSRLRTALACTKEPSLLNRLLRMAMDPNEIRTQDNRHTIQVVAENRWGRDIAFLFVMENFAALANMMSPSNMNRLIQAVTAHFNTPYNLVMLTSLEKADNSTTPYLPAIRQARAQTEINIKWLQQHQQDLKNWLSPQQTPAVRRSFRLPGEVEPIRYTVRLQPHIYGNDDSQFYFQGSCSIMVRVINATNTITLHMDRLNITQANVSVTDPNSTTQTDNLFQDWSYEEGRHLLTLRLKVTLVAGQHYLLDFRHFTGRLTTDGNGFYLSYYMDGSRKVYLATTQMEPPYARKTFPCFDEPALKATFDITLVRRNDTDRNYRSLSNTPLTSSRAITIDGQLWVEDVFEQTPKMPTYLLAFIVSDFMYLENSTNSSNYILPYRTYARPNAIQWARQAHEDGMKMYLWLDRNFQPPYGKHMKKMDNVAVPDFNFGAMENWGLMIYRETILYQPGVTSANNHFWSATVLAHEIAHMWFGDVVSPKWWNYLWLNEAFASWWDVFVPEQVFPTWAVLEDFVTRYQYPTMDSDALATSHPMTADVQSTEEVDAIFDGVTYQKGCAIIRMIQFIMGFENFIRGLNAYLTHPNNELGNADTEDLWEALNAVMLLKGKGSNYVTEKMDPWVTQMGYPVVTVQRTSEGYRLTQQRFLIGSADGVDERYKNPKYNYQWEVPITYATKASPSMNKTAADILWLGKESTLTIPDPSVNDSLSWILLNVDNVGYYRVNYDLATWNALIGQLNTNPKVFTPINRGHFINDAWSLVKAGMLNMSVALSTLDFLQSETALAPWRAFSREVGYLSRMLVSTDVYPDFQDFMRDSVEGPLRTLKLDIPESMVPTDVFVRVEIARHACQNGLSACVNDAKRLFRQWRDTGKNSINANLRQVFYCTAVAAGDSQDWEFVLGQFKVVDDTTESLNLRNALACTRDLVLIRRLLSMIINENEIRTQDVRSTLQYVSSNSAARDLAYSFFVDNFNAFKNRLDVLYLGYALQDVTSHFNTESHLQQLQNFATVNGVSIIRSAVEEAIAQTRTNLAWIRTHLPAIRAWLQGRNNPTTPAPPPPGSYRLPLNLVPYHYNLRLQPHIYGRRSEFFFQGSVKIWFWCVSATDTIVLHQDRLSINSSAIKVLREWNGTQINVVRISEDSKFHFYKIHLSESLQQNESYTVDLPYFRGDMRTSGEGLYLSSYLHSGKTIYLATTQMEPTYARQAFPCFDEPGLKATFNVTMVRYMGTDRKYITLSNMPLQSSTPDPANVTWTEDRFQQSMVMPTYLLAFVVCDYLSWTDSVTLNGTQVLSSVYVRPNRYADARVAQQDGVQLLQWFDHHFRPSYSKYNSKVDHIAIQNFNAGAMENWGLITYRESLLYNTMSTASTRSWIATVMSHELAHMWFGNKVSPKWWEWLWLNEAFASYWETYAVEDLKPTWKSHYEVDMTSGVFSSMQTDGYTTSHPLSNPVETPEEIDNQFSTITYTKGSGIIAMMHMIMGDHFIPALNLYLETNQGGNADHNTLFDALDKYIDQQASISPKYKMKDIMLPWVTQMNHPVLHVTRVNNSTLSLTQERFLYNRASASGTPSTAYQYKYNIPVTFTTSLEKNFNKSFSIDNLLWWNSSSLSLTLGSTPVDWYVINLRHRGFYRVNYDVGNWGRLIAQLNSDHLAIHEVNRAAILDDAWNLAQAGMLSLSIALRTLDYMYKEYSYGPWRVFARETDYMERMIERTELFDDFQLFMQKTVDGPFKNLTFDLPPDNDPPYRVFKMSWIISDACHYEHKGCVNIATRLVGDWQLGLPNSINVNVRARYYCTAVREGGHDVWQFIYNKYQAESDDTEKSRLRSALGCSKDPTILMTFLKMCLYDPEVPVTETYNCIQSVANNRFGRDVALNFVLEHFVQITKSVSITNQRNIVTVVTQHFHSNYHLAQLQFLADTYDTSNITSTLRTIKERTLTNMRWMETNFNVIKEWLQSKSSSSPSEKIYYRLPTAVLPFHYDLRLQPDIYHDNVSDFSFNGTVRIWTRVASATWNVTLHAYRPISVQSLRDSARILHENTADAQLVQEVTYDEPRQFLVIHVNRQLRVGETFIVHLEFFAPSIPSDGTGLYYSSYKDGNQTVYLATTKFEAPYARRAFPCFDEPALKATFDITLVRRESYKGRNYSSTSNNAWRMSTNLQNGWVADHFQTTLRSPTYLLAFIVSDFRCLTNATNTTNQVDYRTCARPNAYQYGQRAQEYGLIEFKWLEDRFDPIYNMSKLENFAIPDFLSGAMENWGLITYREDLLYEEGKTSASMEDWIAEVVAHELAHMWFGNIVSPRWWSWLWLNEAFASFWDFHIVEQDGIRPLWRMTDQFVVQSMHSVMAYDSLLSSHPLTTIVESPAEIQASFDTITYNKGAAIVRMMHFIMGEEDFIAALNIYLHQRQYDVADQYDLWRAFDQYMAVNTSRNLNMSEVLDPWVSQMNYPLVKVSWTQDSQVTLTQVRYLAADSEGSADGPYGYKWDIPITFSTNSAPVQAVTHQNIHWFLKNNSQEVIHNASIGSPTNDNWVLVNVQQLGYYRVTYDDRNWRALIAQLNKNHTVFHPINRAQIINDAWSLAKSGHLNMSIALDTLDFLKNDDDYVPWRAISTELSYIDRMLSTSSFYGKFENYMVQLVWGTFFKLGMTNAISDSPVQIFQRERIVDYACHYGVQECRNNASLLFDGWRNSEGNQSLDVNLQAVVLCNGLRWGSTEDWQFTLQQFQTRQQASIRSALACTRTPWLLNRLLSMTLSGGVFRDQDTRAVVESVASNEVGRDLAWNFFKQNYEALTKKNDSRCIWWNASDHYPALQQTVSA